VSGEQRGSAGEGPRRAGRPGAWAAWPALVVVAAALVAFTMVTHLGHVSRHTLVVASMPYWNFQPDTAVVLANHDAVNEASPWIYGLSASGAIVPQYAPGQAPAIAADIARLRAAQLRIVPSIADVTGGNWDYQAIGRILHNPALLRQHVAAIVALVQRQNYAGIDIDYEQLQAGDRQAFTQFATDLAGALHAHRKILSIAVFPQTAAPASGDSNAAQDYAALGQVADQIRIMGYNDHWANSRPGATAPIGWVRSVLQFATSQIPPSKVVLGIPLFGYDWPTGNAPAATVSWLQALRLSRQYDVPASYDTAGQAPSFSYSVAGSTHIVWFENAASSKAKFAAAKVDGVAGVYLWMYGPEDPGTWPALHAVLPIVGPNASSTSAAVP
jgi:spore germination protein